jgi:hypothetical protein
MSRPQQHTPKITPPTHSTRQALPSIPDPEHDELPELAKAPDIGGGQKDAAPDPTAINANTAAPGSPIEWPAMPPGMKYEAPVPQFVTSHGDWQSKQAAMPAQRLDSDEIPRPSRAAEELADRQEFEEFQAWKAAKANGTLSPAESAGARAGHGQPNRMGKPEPLNEAGKLLATYQAAEKAYKEDYCGTRSDRLLKPFLEAKAALIEAGLMKGDV